MGFSELNIRLMKAHENRPVSEFVRSVFDEFVAPHFIQQGREEFYQYIDPEALARRFLDQSFFLLAFEARNLIGVIEIRESNHIGLFFIEGKCQRKGIGKALLQQAVARCREEDPDLKSMTLHASPNALAAYRNLGFVDQEHERVVNGIRFTTMRYPLDR